MKKWIQLALAISVGASLVASRTAVAVASPGAGQDMTETSLKAQYAYSFAKFTDWPAGSLPAGVPFNACVLGDGDVGDALKRLVDGRTLAGHLMKVTRMELAGAVRSCHLLYVSGVTPAQLTTLLATLRGLPILTISDMENFTTIGGIARLFVLDGKIRFDMNLGLARHAGLQLSAQLLGLAVRVIDTSGGVDR